MLIRHRAFMPIAAALSLLLFNMTAAYSEPKQLFIPNSAKDGTTNLMHISFSMQALVENDMAEATMGLTVQDDTIAAASNTINETMAWVDSQVSAVPQVKLSSSNYSTNPIYDHNEIIGWSVRQSMRLKSSDLEALTDLIGILQERIGLQSISFSPSSEQIALTEDALLIQALDEFQRRAGLAVSSLNGKGFELVDIRINYQSNYPVSTKMRGDIMFEGSAPPVLPAGESQIGISINGTVQIQ